MDQSEVLKFDAKVGVVKLSDAIRIGAQLRPESQRGDYVFFSRCGSCALGAGYQALTGTCPMEDHTLFEKLTDLTGVPNSVLNRASDLFEEAGYSREEVADWLEHQGY